MWLGALCGHLPSNHTTGNATQTTSEEKSGLVETERTGPVATTLSFVGGELSFLEVSSVLVGLQLSGSVSNFFLKASAGKITVFKVNCVFWPVTESIHEVFTWFGSVLMMWSDGG